LAEKKHQRKITDKYVEETLLDEKVEDMEYRVGDVEGIEEELRIEYAYLTRMNHRMLDDEGWRYYEDYQEPPDYGSEEASPR